MVVVPLRVLPHFSVWTDDSGDGICSWSDRKIIKGKNPIRDYLWLYHKWSCLGSVQVIKPRVKKNGLSGRLCIADHSNGNLQTSFHCGKFRRTLLVKVTTWTTSSGPCGVLSK